MNTTPCELILVEDHPSTAKAMSRLLTYYGFRVCIAGGVRAALALCEARGAFLDLIISDLELPDGCGCDLIRQIRQNLDIPAIALTGHASSEDVARTREAGFNAHLIKPITIDVLHDAVRHWCAVGRAARVGPPMPLRPLVATMDNELPRINAA